MNSLEHQNASVEVNALYRVLLMMWFAFLLTVVVYFVLTLFIQRSPVDDRDPRGMITLTLAAVSVLIVIVSLIIKQKILVQAAEKRSLKVAQTAHVIAMALCEIAAILGVGLYIVIGARYYYLLIIISALGLILHRPRRESLLNVSAPRGW
jgi:Tfp pilus assembly protein PilN